MDNNHMTSEKILTTQMLVDRCDMSNSVSGALAWIFMGLMCMIPTVMYVPYLIADDDAFGTISILGLAILLVSCCFGTAWKEIKTTKDAIDDFESGNFIIHERVVTDKKVVYGRRHKHYFVYCGDESFFVKLSSYLESEIGDECYIIVRRAKRKINTVTRKYIQRNNIKFHRNGYRKFKKVNLRALRL